MQVDALMETAARLGIRTKRAKLASLIPFRHHHSASGGNGGGGGGKKRQRRKMAMVEEEEGKDEDDDAPLPSSSISRGKKRRRKMRVEEEEAVDAVAMAIEAAVEEEEEEEGVGDECYRAGCKKRVAPDSRVTVRVCLGVCVAWVRCACLYVCMCVIWMCLLTGGREGGREGGAVHFHIESSSSYYLTAHHMSTRTLHHSPAAPPPAWCRQLRPSYAPWQHCIRSRTLPGCYDRRRKGKGKKRTRCMVVCMHAHQGRDVCFFLLRKHTHVRSRTHLNN